MLGKVPSSFLANDKFKVLLFATLIMTLIGISFITGKQVGPTAEPIDNIQETITSAPTDLDTLISIKIPSKDFYWNLDTEGQFYFSLGGRFYTFRSPYASIGDQFQGPISADSITQDWIFIQSTGSINYELFSIIQLNNQDFLYILRHDQNYYEMYTYPWATQKSRLIKTFAAGTDDTENNVPKFSKENADGTVLMNMFGCWNCGAAQPSQMIYNPQTLEFIRL